MKSFFRASLVTFFALGFIAPAHADDLDAKAILDKALKAMGGEETIGKVKAMTWKSKGQVDVNGTESKFTSQATLQGIDQWRTEQEREFNGNTFKTVSVLNGDKAWRTFNGDRRDMDAETVLLMKDHIYTIGMPVTLLALKKNALKLEAAGEEKVGEKTVVVVKVKVSDAPGFTLSFDKTSGLPIKLLTTDSRMPGRPVENETTFDAYKDFDGIKVATKIVIKRNGQKSSEAEIIEYQALDKVDPATFSEAR